LDLPESGGLLVQEVGRGSPAAAAGLRGATRRVRVGNYLVDIGGDLITHVDGAQIARTNDISRVAARKHAGETIELTIFRDGRTIKVAVRLAAMDDNGVV
jgi:S1-C subfamily serine protease